MLFRPDHILCSLGLLLSSIVSLAFISLLLMSLLLKCGPLICVLFGSSILLALGLVVYFCRAIMKMEIELNQPEA